MASTKILHGDCLDILRRATSNSVDSIVTDPPYGLSFMGKKWDYDVPSKEIWQECLRVLKPGGYLLSFAGTRTQHRMAVNIEDAGFEIRDMIAWIYGSGFPKSLNIGKAVAKAMGEDVKIGTAFKAAGEYGNRNLQDPTPINDREQFRHIPQTEEAKQWEGWGTALKPALEPITVARKPLSEKTVAENVLKWGTGGINIDGSRIETDEDLAKNYTSVRKGDDVMGERGYKLGFRQNKDSIAEAPTNINLGRFPANLIHDGSDEVVSLFPNTKGEIHNKLSSGESMFLPDNQGSKRGFSIKDSGSAARFFMTCKDTQKQAIMSVCNDINVNNVGSNLMISQLIEKIVKIHSVLQNATPNLDLLNQSLNALFVETSADYTETDFVAKLVAIKEVPEDLVSQQELQVSLDFMGNFKNSIQRPKDVNAEKWANIDITQITLNCLKLCGYVLLATDENIKQESLKNDNDPKRFAYIPKASKADRDEGLDGFKNSEGRIGNTMHNANNTSDEASKGFERFEPQPRKNNHPTVKPTKLMQYLVKLVTPKGGTCLDPFMGSGSTGKACKLEGFDFIGIEMDADYIEIAKARINNIQNETITQSA